jgi:hypothetical protein
MNSRDGQQSDELRQLNENSPSVQGHLGIVQSVINRMATNSASAKAWCVTLVSAILVLVGDKGKPALLFLAVIPTLLFLFLDAYYLALEKGFRTSYRSFVTKLHAGKLQADDLYEVVPEGSILPGIFKALLSLSVWPFYTTLGLMIFVAFKVVKD